MTGHCMHGGEYLYLGDASNVTYLKTCPDVCVFSFLDLYLYCHDKETQTQNYILHFFMENYAGRP